MTDYFPKEASMSYDEKNRQLAPIADCMHFLIRLLVRDFPAKQKVLCVGVGTGAEIFSLIKAFPNWTFVGVDPSAAMLDVCREKLKVAGLENRCQLVHGYVQDLPAGENFDIALSILVAHFVKREERLSFFKAMSDRLRAKGSLVNAEISFDLNSENFPGMVEAWKGVQSLMGATPESLANLSQVLREMLSILSPEETENILVQAGIESPLKFFQAFMICAWVGKKK